MRPIIGPSGAEKGWGRHWSTINYKTLRLIMSISIGWAFQVASALSPGINSEGGLVLVYWREGMITRHWDGEEHMWMLPQEPLACCRLPD